MIHYLAKKLRDRVSKREPDVYIGGKETPYMIRWWVIPRNKYFNVYLHHFRRSDEDRALHDHPWWNLSYLIEGSYIEITPVLDIFDSETVGYKRTVRHAGQFAGRKANARHRLELFPMMVDGEPAEQWRWLPAEMPVWTLFITGPKIREWGFWCTKPKKADRWVHWEEFTSPDDERDHNGRVRVATVGRGCGD